MPFQLCCRAVTWWPVHRQAQAGTDNGSAETAESEWNEARRWETFLVETNRKDPVAMATYGHQWFETSEVWTLPWILRSIGSRFFLQRNTGTDAQKQRSGICVLWQFVIIWPDLIWIIWHPLIEIIWNIHKCVTQPSMTLHWYQIHTDPHWFWLIHTAWCWGLKFNSCRQVLSNANPLREFKLHMKLQQLNVIKRDWDNNSEFLKRKTSSLGSNTSGRRKKNKSLQKTKGKRSVGLVFFVFHWACARDRVVVLTRSARLRDVSGLGVKREWQSDRHGTSWYHIWGGGTSWCVSKDGVYVVFCGHWQTWRQ